MPTMSGVVQTHYENARHPLSALVLEGDPVKYSSYEAVPGVSKGDHVTFDYKINGVYTNITGKVTKNNYAEVVPMKGTPETLPVGLTRDRCIVRQNALTNAIKFKELQIVVESVEAITEEDIITTAVLFERYTSGDIDQEVLDKLLDSMTDQTNPISSTG